MPKATLGAKRICPNCHVPFYDLGKNPAHCPNCAHDFDPTEALKTARRGRGNEAVKEEPKAKPPVKDAEAPEGAEAAEGEDGDEADEELLEDTADLGEDDDDVAEVIENVDEAGEER